MCYAVRPKTGLPDLCGGAGSRGLILRRGHDTDERKEGATSSLSTELPDRYAPDVFSTLDGRCQLAKIVRARLAALMADLGGAEALSYLEQSLAYRLIWLEAKIEFFETALATGDDVPLSEYLSAVNVLSGLCKRLGLKRRARPIASLQDYTQARLNGNGNGLA